MLRRLTTTTAPLFFKPSTVAVARTAVVSRSYASSSNDYESSERGDDSSLLGNFGSSSSQSRRNPDRRDELAPQTIHFAGLPMTTTREKFTEALQQAGFTGIQSVGVPTNSYDQRSKGYAFVTFDSVEAANKAKSQPFTYEGATVKLSTTRTAEEQQNLKVYIGDLSYNTTESDLKTALEQFGPVDYVSIASVGTQSKGFGFASFKELSGAQAARSAGKFMLDDRPVRVEIARPRERNRNSSPRYDSKEEDRFGSRGGYGRSEDSYGSRGGDRSYGSRGGDRYGGESSRGGYGGSRGGYGGSRGGEEGGYGGSRGGYGGRNGGSRGGEEY